MDGIETFLMRDLSLAAGSTTNVPFSTPVFSASHLEWDDLLYQQSVRHQPNSNAYGESHLHAKFRSTY